MRGRSGAAGLRALLAEGIHPVAAETLRDAGCEVATLDRALGEDELRERLPDLDLLGIRSGTHVTAEVLRGAPELLAVGAFCIGTNQIDLDTAAAGGVGVFNAPYSNTRSVVELAVAEIIALTRRLTEHNARLHSGDWAKTARGSHEIRGRRLGIVGYGNIGSQLSVLAESLGMSVSFFDTADRLPLGNAHRCDSLEELLAGADVVSLHVDGRSGNRGLFGDGQFRRMRAGAVFLNLSRGFVVDVEALRRHLESGHLAGAAVDVFPQEPRGRGERFSSVLQGLPNVILTPHIAGSTEEAQEDIGRFVAGKLLDYVTTGATSSCVNLPQLALPERRDTHRVVHVHHNTPGVLAAINGTLAEHGVNIEGQYLGTRGLLGYVITDVGTDYSAEMVVALGALPETVRVRLLS